MLSHFFNFVKIKMIIIWNNFEWHYFTEYVGNYLVSGTLMTEPDPVNGNPIIHDIEINEIWDYEQEKDLTNVICHDYITAELETRLI